MKLSVTIYGLNEQGEDMQKGRIHLNETTIYADPADSPLLRNIMAESVMWPGQQPIDPRNEPEKWMRNLWQMYRSPYLKATKAAIE